jgi:hypothetical protein
MAFIGAKWKALTDGANGSGAGFSHEGQLGEKSILRGIYRRRSNLQISKAGPEMSSPIFSTLQLFAMFVGDGAGSQPEFILVLAERLLGGSTLNRLDLKNCEQLRGSSNRGTVPAMILVIGFGREGTFE